MPYISTPEGILANPKKKPLFQQARINWLHPISRKLRMCFQFDENKGTKLRDIARINTAEISGVANIGWSPTAFGQSLVYTGSATNNQITVTSKCPASTVWTLETMFRLNSDVGASSAFLWTSDDSGYQFKFSTPSYYFTIWSGNETSDWNYAITAGTWIHLVVLANGTTVTPYYDSIPTVTALSPTNPLYISRITKFFNDGYSEPFLGNLIYIRAWDRLLDGHEIQKLYRNPYCFLEPVESARRYFYSSEAPPVSVPIPVAMNTYRQLRRT